MGCGAGETGHSHADQVDELVVWLAFFVFLVNFMCGVWAFYMAMCGPIWTMGPEYNPAMQAGVVLK